MRRDLVLLDVVYDGRHIELKMELQLVLSIWKWDCIRKVHLLCGGGDDDDFVYLVDYSF